MVKFPENKLTVGDVVIFVACSALFLSWGLCGLAGVVAMSVLLCMRKMKNNGGRFPAAGLSDFVWVCRT